MRPRSAFRCVAVAVAVALTSAPASAWVRSTTPSGAPLAWPGSCVWIFPDNGGSPDLPIVSVVDVLAKSIANWQDVTVKAGCSYFVINQDPPAPGEAHQDRINVLKFRTDKWCRPAESGRAETCYDSTAAAITTTFYNTGKADDGAIFDSDIQMNNLNFTFVVEPSSTPARPGTSIADLENTLTHELGHFQGLDHTCWIPSDNPDAPSTPPIDGSTGMQIPSCADVLAMPSKVPVAERLRITGATMYNFAAPGETSKRAPKADDIAGICAIYPEAKDPKVCERPNLTSDSGCSTASRPSPRGLPATLAISLLLAGAGFVRRVRRR